MLVRTEENPVCLVVDVVRASTSIITIMEKGCEILGNLDEVEAVKSA